MKILPSGRVPITEENFPDEKFRQFIKERISGTEKVITPEKINKLRELAIPVGKEKIKSFSGIECLTGLKEICFYSYDDIEMAEADFTSALKIEGLETFSVTGVALPKKHKGILCFPASKHLQHISIFDSNLTHLDVSGLPNLRHLACVNSVLYGVDVSYNPKLSVLALGQNPLKELYLDGCEELKELLLPNTTIEKVDFSNCPKVEKLLLTGSWHLKEIVFPAYSMLRTFEMTNAPNITELNFDWNQNIEKIEITNSGIKTFKANNCADLKSIILTDNQVESLEVNGCENLKSILSGNNMIQNLKLSGLPKLERLNIVNNMVQKLDIREFINLNEIAIQGNPLRECLLTNTQERAIMRT